MRKSDLIRVYESNGFKYRPNYDGIRIKNLLKFAKDIESLNIKIKYFDGVDKPEQSKYWGNHRVVGRRKYPTEQTLWAYTLRFKEV